MRIDASGANGSAGTSNGGTAGGAGVGHERTGTLAVTHGQTLYACVGLGGGSASGSGGAGGGASGLSVGADFSSPVLVSGGGGGGGGGVTGGAGGAGGAAGGTGNPGTGGTNPGSGGAAGSAGGNSTASGPGVGSPAVNGSGGSGGAGGGGYGGGGAGTPGGTLGGGGGGGGGSDYCDTSRMTNCSTPVAGPGTAALTLTYTVASPPTATITTPANGATYTPYQNVHTNFSCAEGSGGSGLTSCADQSGQGPGTQLDTWDPGTHTVTVTATSSDGLTSSTSATYTVASPPTVSITTPADGATYEQNQVVSSSFSCTEGAGGPGVSSCLDQSGKGSGAGIDTSTTGQHTFTATAVSKDGERASASVTYTVLGAPAPFTISTPSSRAGVITISLGLPGPGTIAVVEVGAFTNLARIAPRHRARTAALAPGTFVFGQLQATATNAGTVRVKIKPSDVAKILLRFHRSAVRIQLFVTYTRIGSLPHPVEIDGVRVR